MSLFEIGTVFVAPHPGDLLPNEQVHVGAVLSGAAASVGDVVDLARALESVLRLEELDLVADPVPGLHPGRAVRVVAEGIDVGVLGEVSPSVVVGHGLDAAMYLELDLRALCAAPRRSEQYRPISSFPPVNIDLAFLVSDAVPAAQVAATIRHASGPLLESCGLFDEFRSDGLGSRMKSLAFALRFRALDRTLTDDDVAPLRQAAIDAVVGTLGASLRS